MTYEYSNSMPDAALDVLEEGGAAHSVAITESPFRIGRTSADGKNTLVLDDVRISRQSAAIICKEGRFLLEDLGQRRGLFLNGRKVEEPEVLKEGDVITFANADNISIVFRTGQKRESLSDLLSRMDESTAGATIDRDLRQLNLLLEATALLQAHLPLDEVLGAMVERAIAVTEADRGLLFEADSEGNLEPFVARRRGGFTLPPATVVPSQTAIEHALDQRRSFIEVDLNLADESVREAASIVNQQLRSIIAVPLYSLARMDLIDSTSVSSGDSLLGLLYMDSRRPAAFSGLGMQVLDALAIEASSVIDNAHMVKIERERRQMEQELGTARKIQRNLLPRELKILRFWKLPASTNPAIWSVAIISTW